MFSYLTSIYILIALMMWWKAYERKKKVEKGAIELIKSIKYYELMLI